MRLLDEDGFCYGVGKAELSCVEISSGLLGELLDCVWWWVHQIEQKCVIFLVLVFFCFWISILCMFQLNFAIWSIRLQLSVIVSAWFLHTRTIHFFSFFCCTGMNFILFFPTFFFENSNYARMFASLFQLSHNVTQNWFGNFLPSPLLLHANKLNIPGLILSKSSPNGSTCVKNDNWKVTNFEKMY